MEELRVGTDGAFLVFGDVDSDGFIEIVMTDGYGNDTEEWLTKEDAERLIAHLQQAFNIGDKQDD